jgi:hypothetical protein
MVVIINIFFIVIFTQYMFNHLQNFPILFFSFCDVIVKWRVHIFQFQKFIAISKWFFYE